LSRGFFVTGTDTNAGKTHVSGELMGFIMAAGIRVAGMKPVASGGHWVSGQWRNEDALHLASLASLKLPYEWVNPYAFNQPIAPHLAARHEGRTICIDTIRAQFRKIESEVDAVVVEGAGGWLCPLDEGLDISDLACDLALPVILVVGIRLGCINHARLTDRAIRSTQVPYAGWVANFIDPEFTARDETVETLTGFLGRKPLGQVGFKIPDSRVECSQNNHWNRGEILRRLLP
jgi:dethiobiotin synthetase